MKKIIIHVGQYKTGSTSIQKLLWAERDELQKNGVLYPQSFTRDGAHFLISDLLRKEFRSSGERVDLSPLREEIERSSANTVVLSCEALSGATVRRFSPDMMLYIWQRLAGVLNGMQVKVVFYVRRQDESIDSRIIQEIKGQARKSTASHQPFLYPMSSLDYHYFKKLLEHVFGKGNVESRLYDRRYLRNSDVRSDFLDYIGLDDGTIALPEREDNVSPSARLVGYYRVINSLNLDPDTYTEISRGMWRAFNGGGKPKAVALGTKDRTEVMEYFEEKNRLFIAECVPVKHKELYSESLFSGVRDVDANIAIDAVEALRLLGKKGFDVVRSKDLLANTLKVTV